MGNVEATKRVLAWADVNCQEWGSWERSRKVKSTLNLRHLSVEHLAFTGVYSNVGIFFKLVTSCLHFVGETDGFGFGGM